MPETFIEKVNRILRDHEGYTGDGQGGVGDLPTGDMSTARKPISKRDLREIIMESPESISLSQFGAVGDGVTDDSAAIQAAFDYAAENSRQFFEVDNGTEASRGWWSVMRIVGENGALYAMSEGVTNEYRNRGLVVSGASFIAIGAGWSTSDFMFAPADAYGSDVVFRDVHLNCAHLCSGMQLRAFSRAEECHVYGYAGKGISLAGSAARAVGCKLAEYDINEDGFYDYTNYTGTGIHFEDSGNDSAAESCIIKWSAKLVVTESNTFALRGCHLTNGMEHWSDNSGTPRPGGAVLIEHLDSGAGENIGAVENCYLDNGIVINYNQPVTYDGTWVFALDHACPADETHWFHIYPDAVGSLDQTTILDMRVGTTDLTKKWVTWYSTDGSNDWNASFESGHTAFEASDQNDADEKGKPFEISSRMVKIAPFTIVSETYGFGVQSLHKMWDRTTEAEDGTYYGVAGDKFIAGGDKGVDFRGKEATHNGSKLALESRLGVLTMAHRTAMDLAPENTLAGVGAAYLAGFDGFEIDYQPTSDGELICIHDSTVDRTTSQTGNVAEISLATIQGAAYEVGSHFADRFDGAQVPLLSDVLDFAMGKFSRIHLELKNTHSEANMDAALALVTARGLEDVVIFISYTNSHLEYIRSQNTEVGIGYIDATFEEIDTMAEQGGRVYCSFTDSEMTDHPTAVADAQAAGIEVYGKTTNTYNEAMEYLQKGIKVIQSDIGIFTTPRTPTGDVRSIAYDLSDVTLNVNTADSSITSNASTGVISIDSRATGGRDVIEVEMDMFGGDYVWVEAYVRHVSGDPVRFYLDADTFGDDNILYQPSVTGDIYKIGGYLYMPAADDDVNTNPLRIGYGGAASGESDIWDVKIVRSSRAYDVSSTGDFASRSDAVTWAGNNTPKRGRVIRAGGIAWEFETYALNVISDMPGWKPHGNITPNHWTENTTPGTTDMGPALLAAAHVNGTGGAETTNGHTIHLLAEDYAMTNQVLIRDNINIVSDNDQGGRIKFLEATGDGITFGDGTSIYNNGGMRNVTLAMASGVEKTSGFAINCNRMKYGRFQDINIEEFYSGIYVFGSEKVTLERVVGENQTGVRVGKAGTFIEFAYDATNAKECGDCRVNNCRVSSGADGMMVNGVLIGSADGLHVDECNFNKCDYDVHIATSSTVSIGGVQINDNYLDRCDEHNVYISGDGQLQGSRFASNRYRASQGDAAIQIDAGVTIASVQFEGGDIMQAQGHAVNCLSTDVTGLSFVGVLSSGNLVDATTTEEMTFVRPVSIRACKFVGGYSGATTIDFPTGVHLSVQSGNDFSESTNGVEIRGNWTDQAGFYHIELNDDAVFDIPLKAPRLGGRATVTTFTAAGAVQGNRSGRIWFEAHDSGSLDIEKITADHTGGGTLLNVSTTDLDETTADDGDNTVVVQEAILRLINRAGGQRRMTVKMVA